MAAPDFYRIDCGAASNTSSGDRHWQEDDAVLLGQGTATKFGFSRLALKLSPPQRWWRFRERRQRHPAALLGVRRPWIHRGRRGRGGSQDFSSSIKFTKEVPEFIAPRCCLWHGTVLGISNTVSNTFKISWSFPSSPATHYSVTPANSCKHFSLQQIVDATDGFDDDLLLGVGGFGKCTKERSMAAQKSRWKRGNPMSEQGMTEFQTEIEMLSKLRHRHLVSLIGYCDELGDDPRLRLHGERAPPRTSLRIRCPDAVVEAKAGNLHWCCAGLHYLHTGAQRAIIHRDVKTTNILLDEKFVAKVSDFGLSKVGPSLDHTRTWKYRSEGKLWLPGPGVLPEAAANREVRRLLVWSGAHGGGVRSAGDKSSASQRSS
ncbi:hypothetical protein JRQ81_000049 [Phrynocephalus forsythii]|uniref:Protein kinase domain-containing protein n=1 Tax=Phrynocephalus forsythii TaxID=171643 RepID=A0A9Q0X581_9SAUR|nr:hypothetical protein JRQ81_000049 [Phrynocephalus forsythii]